MDGYSSAMWFVLTRYGVFFFSDQAARHPIFQSPISNLQYQISNNIRGCPYLYSGIELPPYELAAFQVQTQSKYSVLPSKYLLLAPRWYSLVPTGT